MPCPVGALNGMESVRSTALRGFYETGGVRSWDGSRSAAGARGTGAGTGERQWSGPPSPRDGRRYNRSNVPVCRFFRTSCQANAVPFIAT